MALSKEEIRKTYGSETLGIPEKIKKVLLSPSEFFNAVKGEEGFKNAFVYIALISIVSIALNYFLSSQYSAMLARFGLPSALGIAIILVIWLFGLIFSFIAVGFFHIFVYLLGGKEGFTNTYKAFAYASTPSSLLGWIPFIGIIFSLWSLYLEIKGISVLQNMGMGRALAVILIPIAIIAIIIFLLFYALIMSILNPVAVVE